jgi:ABC-type multidrug transport system fused ATPase/permease subunit
MISAFRFAFRPHISTFGWVVRLAPGAKSSLAVVIFLQALAGFAQNLSLISLLPIIQTLVTGGTADSGVGAALADVVGFFGLSPSLKSFIALAIVAGTMRAIISIVSINYTNNVVLNVATDLRQRLAYRMFGLDWTTLNQLGTGHVVAVIVTEIERVRVAFGSSIAVLTGFVQASIYIATSFLVSAPLTLLALALGIGKGIALRPLQKIGRRGGRRLSQFTSVMNLTLLESLQNMKMLKVMGRENVLLTRFIRQSESYSSAAKEIQQSAAWLKVLEEYLTALLLAGAFYLASTTIGIGIAEIAVISVLLNRLLTQLGSLQKSLHVIATHSGAIELAMNCISEWPAGQSNTGTNAIALKKEIRLDDLAVGYSGKPILSNIALTLPAGRLYALVGPSGSGKTTLVDTILGLNRPVSGRVCIDGVDLFKADMAAWRSRVGYMPQELMLFNDTILFNLLLDDKTLSEDDAKRALVAAEAFKFVESLPNDISSVLAERGANMSGGQRQRLGLARALVHAKDLLIVDEATTALSVSMELDICRTLRKLVDETGITIIAISHQSAIVELADQVLSVSDGSVRISDPKKV